MMRQVPSELSIGLRLIRDVPSEISDVDGMHEPTPTKGFIVEQGEVSYVVAADLRSTMDERFLHSAVASRSGSAASHQDRCA